MNSSDRVVTYLTDIFSGETDVVSFDFSKYATPTMPVGNPVVSCQALANDDDTPQAFLIGLPSLVPGGLKIEQQIVGTVRGVSYLLLCTVLVDGFKRTAAGVIRTI